jgi:hypothetical protein
MEIVKLLEDMEQKIKEVKELLATFKALQLELEHERFAVQSQELEKPVLERSDNERFAVQSQFDKLSQSLIPDSPTKFMDALEIAFTEPKKRGRKKKVQA